VVVGCFRGGGGVRSYQGEAGKMPVEVSGPAFALSKGRASRRNLGGRATEAPGYADDEGASLMSCLRMQR